MCEYILVLVLFIFIIYYKCLNVLPSKIPINLLFPNNDDIDSHKVILYSRINIDGKNTILLDRNNLIHKNVKEHTLRDKKIKLYINNRITSNIKKKLKHWINHIRYKPGSREYYKLVKQYKF